MRYRFGRVLVELHDGWTVTKLPNGREVHALHAEQPGQAATAARLGCSVEDMNRTHDLIHSLLAHALGLECSPALGAVAASLPSTALHAAEEEAVLAVQRFAFMAGVRLV